jgi:A/G-specific adenine glycosylase
MHDRLGGDPILTVMGRNVQGVASAADLATARSAAELLESWYAVSGRRFPWRLWTDEYRVLVTEVLLQRTRAAAVEAVLPTLFSAYPSWSAMAAAPPGELESVIAVLGLASRRGATLRRLATDRDDSTGSDYASTAGIGQYISRAVRVTILASREAMVDTNFVRIVHRLLPGPWMADYRFDRRLQAIGLELVKAAKDPRVANWAVLDLGAVTCTPRQPSCPTCPLRAHCVTGQRDTRGIGDGVDDPEVKAATWP